MAIKAVPGGSKGKVSPPLVSSASSENIRQAKLLAVSTDDIEDRFKRGYIDAGQYSDVLRERAHAVLDKAIADNGVLQTALTETIKGLQEGWDTVVKSAKETQKAEGAPGVGGVLDRAKPAGMMFWGMAQAVGGLFASFHVAGQQVEQWALKAGASPGSARILNIITEQGLGVAPMGQAVKTGVKAAQGVMKIGAKKVAAEAGAVEAVAADAIKQGLATEGVVIKEGTVEASTAAGAAAEMATKAATTPREQFISDFDKFRREMSQVTEPQSHAETARLAKKLNIGLDELRNISPGQSLSAPEMYAYLKALEPQWESAIELAKVAKVSGSEADLNAFAGQMSAFLSVAPIFRGAEVQAGRSVEILKEQPAMKQITDMLVGWSPKSMSDGDFMGAMRTMAEDISMARPQDMAGLAVNSRTLLTQFKEGAWPKIREVYYNMLLPFAIIPNTLGNSIGMANMALERTVGGLFSADKTKGLIGQEGWFVTKGYTAAFGDGLSEFGRAFKPLSAEELAREGTKLDFHPHEIGGVMGRIINAPTDAIRGVDGAARVMLRRGSYTSDAIREGVHRGMSDTAEVINTPAYKAQFGNESLTEFVSRRVRFPNKAMVENGDVAATHHSYQDQLGYLADRFRGISQYGPLSLYFPFMKSPINLIKYAWDRTPGLQLFSGQLYRDIAAGGAKADEAIGRITIANMQGMFLYQMAQEGFITGSGPADPALKNAWLATHQPYSIKTPNGWISYANFEPLTTVVGLVSDFAQIHNQLDDHSSGKFGMNVMFAIMHSMGDKSWWRTLNSFTDVAGQIREGVSPNAKLWDIGLSPVTTVASGGALGGYAKRAIDPMMRETRELGDMFLSRIPGFSQNVPPLRDGYGDPVLPMQSIAGPWLGVAIPLKGKTIEPDRVKEEGDKLKIKIPKFPDSIGGSAKDDFDIRAPRPGETVGVPMTTEERDRAQLLYKTFLRNPKTGIEEALMGDQDYQEATPAMQREMFSDALATYRKQGITALTLERPEIGKRVIQSEATKLLPFLQRNEQEELKRDTQEAMDLFEKTAPEELENLMRWGEAPGESE